MKSRSQLKVISLFQETHLFFILVAFSYLFFLSSCSPEEITSAKKEGAKSVSGQVILKEDMNGEDFTIEVLTPNGERLVPTDLLFSKEGAFSFKLNKTMLHQVNRTAAERFILQETEPEAPEKEFFDSSKYTLLAQIVPKNPQGSGSFIMPYRQFTVSFSAQDLIREDIPVKVNSLEISEIGATWLSVVDEANNPAADVQMVAFSSGETDNEGATVKAWQLEGFRPSFTKTDATGRALVFPIIQSSGIGRFQYLLKKDGFCSYFSPKLLFKTELSTQEEVANLTSCEVTDSKEITIKIIDDTPNFKETVLDKETIVGYSNTTRIKLRLETTSRPSGEMRLTLGESFLAEIPNPITDTVFPEFVSEIDLDIPIQFPSSGTENGAYTVKFSTTSGHNGTFYGRKNISKPGIAFMDDLKVLSSVSYEGIISGLPGVGFSVSASFCSDGESLGIAATLQTPVFKPCKDGVANFTSDDVEFSGKEEKKGGPEDLRFFFKDKYENASIDDINKGNVKAIFIDYGTPSFEDSSPSLGIAFGFLRKNITDYGTGEDSNIFDFYKYAEDQGLPLSVQTLVNEDNIQVAFSSPENCLLNIDSSIDGTSSSDLGVKVSGFAIVAKDAEKPTDFWKCNENDRSTLHTVGASHFKDGSFDLYIQDLSGNIGGPKNYTLPTCADATSGETYCW